MRYLTKPTLYLFIIVIIFLLHAHHFNFFVCDDAFISYTYAKNFIRGNGLVFNVGEQPPVEGYTNFLWVMLISLFLKMGFDPIIVSKVLSVSFGVGCLYVTYLFSKLILRRDGFVALIAPLILACCGPYAAWSTEGLETQMFTFFTLAACCAYLYEIQCNTMIPLSALLFSLASLTRPEGVLLFGITCLHLFYHHRQSKKSFFSGKTCTWFFTFIIIYGIYFYWRFNYYGFIFPNTFYAKTGGGVYQAWRGFKYLMRFLYYNEWALLTSLILISLFKSLRFPLVYLSAVVVSFSVYIVLIGGDYFGMFRFFVPVLPLMAILVQEGVVDFFLWIAKLPYASYVKRWAVTFSSLIFFIIFTLSVSTSFTGYEMRIFSFHQTVAQYFAAEGKWLRVHASPHETVAAVGIGAISYYSELHVIDRLGITDIHVAHTKMSHMGKWTAGHEKRNLSYILDKKPNYFSGPLAWPEKSKYFLPSEAETARFNQLYEPFHAQEGGRTISLYKLKDSQ